MSRISVQFMFLFCIGPLTSTLTAAFLLPRPTARGSCQDSLCNYEDTLKELRHREQKNMFVLGNAPNENINEDRDDNEFTEETKTNNEFEEQEKFMGLEPNPDYAGKGEIPMFTGLVIFVASTCFSIFALVQVFNDYEYFK